MTLLLSLAKNLRAKIQYGLLDPPFPEELLIDEEPRIIILYETIKDYGTFNPWLED